MKKIIIAFVAFVLFCSHIMYLKMDSYFLDPDTPTQIQLFNGTFDKSENVIDRDRMLDVSLLGNGNRIKVDDSQWSEKDSITLLNFQTGEAGTWVAGVSTAPRSIEMDAEAFNTYLEHEGILDMLEWRKKNNALDAAAVEKYSKHVKTIFQVGEKRTNDWQTPLGYPIEFIPLDNPYDLNTGDSFKFKLLLNGNPLANQLVYADFKGSSNTHTHDATAATDHHSHDKKPSTSSEHTHGGSTHSHEKEPEKEHHHEESIETHTHTSGQQLRTDAKGIATAKLTADGIWHLQTIHLIPTEEEGMTHESNWSTLTFEVTHGHGADSHTHDASEGGIPSYLYGLGSILLVGLLFLYFNKKK